jgi:hypothetical protein
VEKKNTEKIQVCINFRHLNKATPKDEYPMPIADMLISNASRHRVISFLDGNAGYNLSVFSTPANYGVIKIMCSSSEVISDMLISNASGHRVISFLDGNAGYNLSVFSTPANYGVVKITRFSSEVVL